MALFVGMVVCTHGNDLRETGLNAGDISHSRTERLARILQRNRVYGKLVGLPSMDALWNFVSGRRQQLLTDSYLHVSAVIHSIIIATIIAVIVGIAVYRSPAGSAIATALASTIRLTPQQLETAWLRANSGNQSSQDVAEIAVWLVLVLAGFGLAGLLLIRPRHS